LGLWAFTSTGDWFRLQWPDSWASIHITVKVAANCDVQALWDKKWIGSSLLWWCNNAAVIAILKSGWCKDELAMHFLRSLFFWLASFRVLMVGEHISGILNKPADALSRSNVSSFVSQVPYAYQQPTEVP